MSEVDAGAIKKFVVNDEFRDHIATINEAGKRNYIFPKKPHGKFYNRRTIATLVFLALFIGLPFVRVSGEPLFLFDVLHRKFILFGAIFWPQDFVIFGLGMLTFIVFIVLFTVVFGRVFCGWACPQTIFLEMIFRRIEYWIDGDAAAQKKLAAQPWNAEKIRKRSLKLGVFYLISFIIANFFLAYIISTDELFKMIREPLSLHAGGFTSLLIFSGVFFFVFAWFREQACLIVCPYGRLQGVMLDRNSIVVAYDYERGEPRGKIRKTGGEIHGDCVDCALCVKVCPTGIDIRNGTQMECINCTACIDACNEVMEKTHRPKGLIRYASEAGIAEKKPLRLTTRIKAYSGVLVVLLGVLVFLLVSRSAVEATVLRAGGQIYQEQPGGKISNLYTVRVVNKTRDEIPVTFKIQSGDGEIKMIGKDITVKKEAKAESEFFIIRDRSNIHKQKTPLVVGVYSGDKLIESLSTNFLGPVYDPNGEKSGDEKKDEEHHEEK